MGELTGRVGPQTTLLVEKVAGGVKWSIPVMVPDLEHMDPAAKEALRLKLAASIDAKVLADLAEQQRRHLPLSMGYRPPDGLLVPMPYEMPDSHILYEKRPSPGPSTSLLQPSWKVDGKLCLTTTALVQAHRARRNTDRGDDGDWLGS